MILMTLMQIDFLVYKRMDITFCWMDITVCYKPSGRYAFSNAVGDASNDMALIVQEREFHSLPMLSSGNCQ